jgi:DNA-binding response OmpR family regulator
VNSLRILVAEDDAMIAMLLADVLAGLGHDVCAIVETEAETVAAAALCLPDLMIVDVNLYEGSGISAVAEIARARFVPHFFLTGDLYQIRGVEPGAIVVQKPVLAHELIAAIERATRPLCNTVEAAG